MLLSLYKLPASARDEFIGVLERLKDRLWIPYQVGLEFQRNRLTVISTGRKAVEDVLGNTKTTIDQLKVDLMSLQLEKRGLEIDTATLLADLDKTNQQIVQSIEKAREAQLDISAIQ